MVEEKELCIRRLRRLFLQATLSELLEVESQLRDTVGKRSEKPNKKVQNPTGITKGGACSVCRAPRFPEPNHAPWHVRKGKGGVLLAKSGVCAPCLWASRQKLPREQWPHWAEFKAKRWPRQVAASMDT